MAVVMNMHWPEVTVELYEEALRLVNWENEPAEGGKFHVAWMAEDGFHVLDLWESPEAFQKFAAERLMPGIAELGMTTEPHVEMSQPIRVFVPNPEAVSA